MFNVKFLNGHLAIQVNRKHQFFMQCVLYQFLSILCISVFDQIHQINLFQFNCIFQLISGTELQR